MSETKIHVPNPAVLQAAFANIQANLAYWNQSAWVAGMDWTPPENTCGTTACLAGHILLSQGVEWQDLRGRDIQHEAMHLLGFRLEERMCIEPMCCLPDSTSASASVHVHWVWSGDGGDLNKVFFQMSTEDGGPLRYDQAAFDEFKAYVSELTGVEL